MTFNWMKKFDYIILCNIFEYAKSFVESENPYVDYLNYLKKIFKRGWSHTDCLEQPPGFEILFWF